MNEETLKSVSGGQDGYSAAMDGFKTGTLESKMLVCPVCGKELNIFSCGGAATELHTTCPHCGEHITVML